MNFLQLVFLCITASHVFAESAIYSLDPKSNSLGENEIIALAKIKKTPGVVRSHLIAINSKVLAVSDHVEVPLFDGENGRFRHLKSEVGSGWMGKGEANYDRISVRNFSGKYSGQILHNGRQYSLVPVGVGISLVYEVSGGLKCETAQPKPNKVGDK